MDRGARLAGRYRIVEELGAGGMAVVYRAEDETLRRQVAVKVLHAHLARRPEIGKRLLREARAAAALEHPNILRIIDVVASAGDEPAHIVMELVRGESLDEFLKREGAPFAEVVALVGIVLAEAIGAAHAAGVIHRDVKPSNVLIAEGGRLVVCDFGLAQISDDDATLTQTGATMGTPAFMAPEQALAQGTDARSDLYSLGATLYQLATGVAPATGSTPLVLAKVAKGEIEAPLRRNPRLGGELARIIERAMARAREERFQTAAELAAALRGVVADLGFGEPSAELTTYFAGPGDWNRVAYPKILATTLTRARAAAARREYVRALAFVDRVLAFEPEHVEANELARTVGRGARAGRRRLVLAAVLAACAAGAGAIALTTGGPPAPQAVAAVVDGAPPEVLAVPDAAPAMVAAVTAVDAAARPSDATPQAAVGRLARPDAAVAAAPPPPPLAKPPDAAPAAPPSPPALAQLEVKIRPWCDIEIDGLARGQSPAAAPIELAAGRHRLVCAQNTVGGRRLERTIVLAPGERQVVSESLLAPVQVTLAVAGATVRIDGAAHPGSGRVSLDPGRHRVEIVRDGKVEQTGYVSVPPRACTLKAQPELACD